MKNAIILFLFLLVSTFSFSQNRNFRLVKPYTWMLGVYWNNVIDDGHGGTYLFDTQNSWNLPKLPSAVNVDVYLLKGMSIDVIGSHNYYELGKRIDKDTTVSGQFFSLKTHFKYSFGYILEQQWFDPFTFAGVGYTGREAIDPQSMFGLSFGAGFNLMIGGGLGIQVRGSGNVGVLSKDSNYGHAHFGLIYKVPDLDKKKSNHFTKRKYQWGFKRPRYRKPNSRRM